MSTTSIKSSSTPSRWKQARSSLAIGLSVLLAGCTLFTVFLLRMPRLEADKMQYLVHNFPPKSLDSLRSVRDILLEYASVHPVLTGTALSMLYILMQTFAVPGTLNLTILAGAFFGVNIGWILVAVVSTMGSCSCYLLSWCIGRPLVHAIWPDKVEQFQKEIEKRKKDLFNYMLFLRVTPVLPNTFINMAAPIVGVPLWVFGLGTFLGCLPNNFVAVNAGVRLSELNSLSDLFDVRMVVLGIVVGIVALVPVFLKGKSEEAEKQD